MLWKLLDKLLEFHQSWAYLSLLSRVENGQKHAIVPFLNIKNFFLPHGYVELVEQYDFTEVFEAYKHPSNAAQLVRGSFRLPPNYLITITNIQMLNLLVTQCKVNTNYAMVNLDFIPYLCPVFPCIDQQIHI